VSKSRKSAIQLSAAAVLSFAVTSAVVNILLPYLLTGDVQAIIERPDRLSQPGQVLALVGILNIFILILIGLGAFWLYRFFGEGYYGPHGAARWALFGALLALLLKLPDWLLPESLWLLRDAIWILSPFIAFFIARWLVPIKQRTTEGIASNRTS
jgi:hypothetical protein